MKRIITIFFAIIVAFSAYSQTHIMDGDQCFESGDYACAVTNYNNAFNNATGKDKQIAEIKLSRAKWCADHIKSANQAFAAKNYSTAKDDYQKVLDSNPKDSYAQSQIVKCDDALNQPKLRKATAADLADLWDNKYGIQPQRRQNLINAGIDPDDTQRRINAGEGKPQEKEKQATNFSVSKSTLHFTSHGETSEQIKVFSFASTYFVPPGYVPRWCTVLTYNGYFTVTASANPNSTVRKDWFKVTAGGKEVRIDVEQAGRKSANTKRSQRNTKKCFNCPKTQHPWGFTFGYGQYNNDYYAMDVYQIGLKAEPLFKYGFGLNTGINFMEYSINDYGVYENNLDFYAFNVPLHLEYRLNFSKWFNVFSYGGVGFNILSDTDLDNFTYPVTFEYGGGFRINHVQFNVGKSLYLGDFSNTQDFGKYTGTFLDLILSVSYMF